MNPTEDQLQGIEIRDKLQRAILFYEEINALLHTATEDAVTQNRVSMHNYLSLKNQLPAMKNQFEKLVMGMATLVRG